MKTKATATGIGIRMIRWTALLMVVFGCAGTHCAPAVADGISVVGVQKLSPRMSELTVRSNVLLGDVPMRVILPSDYDVNQSRRYPVLYMHTGTDQTPANVTDSVDLEAFTAKTPVIIVIPSGGNGSYYTNWFNGGLFGPPEWETFHLHQVIPYIDSHYRTIADRSGRAISGISMGGFGSMSYAARHPDLFAAAVSFSGAVNTNYPPQMAVTTGSAKDDGGAPDSEFGPRATQEVRWRGHNPVDLAGNLRGVDLQILAHNGLPGGSYEITGDPLEYGVHQESADLHDQLAALGVPHAWYDLGPGGHVPGDIQTEIHIALPHVMSIFEHPPAAPAEFTYESIEPQFSVWDWSLQADPARALEFLRVQNARAGGLTLVGSGRTNVTTPPFFRGLTAVDLVTSDRVSVVKPDHDGRLHFTVDLGPAHTNQQYTQASQLTGDGTTSYFTTRTVTFAPVIVGGGGQGVNGGLASAVPGAANSTSLAIVGKGAQACVPAKRLSFRINPVPHGRVVSVGVTVNGRHLLTKTGHDVKHVSFARPPGSRLVVVIVTINNHGGGVVTTRTFRGCTRTKVSGTVLGHARPHRRSHRRSR